MSLERLPTVGLRKLAIVLLVVMLPPAATLVWLGFQLLDQDRNLLERHDLERRQTAAKAAAESFKASLESAQLLFAPGAAADGIARVTLTADAVLIDPPLRLLWTPVPQPLAPTASEPFAEAESYEYQQRENQALAIYGRWARSPIQAVRAGALVRLARLHGQRREWDAAIDAYRSLSNVRGVSYEGVPVDLLARRGICSILEAAHRTMELLSEAKGLSTDFVAGRWLLDGPTWRGTEKELQRWSGQSLEVSDDERVIAEAVGWLWDRRSALREQSIATPRLQTLDDPFRTMVLMRLDGNTMTSLVVLPTALNAWIEKAAKVSPDDRVALRDGSGVLVGSDPLPGAPHVEEGIEATSWRLVLSPRDPEALSRTLAQHRRLLPIGLASVLVLLLGGGLALWRVVRREVTVARQHSEFVAAVSHEFRTPLTSLRHLTELLQEADDMPAERRRSFYDALGRNTSRLHRLVETLLDFARMESGRRPYSMQLVELNAFVSHVVTEFQESLEPGRATVIVDAATVPHVHARLDVPAMTTTLWNLLDNSVKYSEGCAAVRVSVQQRAETVAITVSDKGFGIPATERSDLFQRFVRGRKAQELRIAGTGLGLAIVAHIVRTHEGRIEVDSEVGRGSTFSIVLPRFEVGHPGATDTDRSAA